jgi:membrane protein required for beta-lactamase induction
MAALSLVFITVVVIYAVRLERRNRGRPTGGGWSGLHRVLEFIRRVNNSAVVHGCLMILWILLIIPTLLWWRESILWIAFMSLYAIISTHASAIEAALAKQQAEGGTSGNQEAH